MTGGNGANRPAAPRRPGGTAANAAAAALLTAGVDRHRSGRLDEAEDLYRRVLQAAPEQPDALHLLGRIASARGDASAALDLTRRAICARPDAAAFRVSLGAVMLALGRTAEAIESLEEALRRAPDDPEAHNTLGNALLAAGDAEAAVTRFRRALASRPEYPEAHNNLGSALRRLGRPDEAEAALRAALALRPAYASALANLGLVLQERARWAEALDAYDRALAADPGHAAARGNRSMLLLLLGRLDEGFAEYEWRWRMPGFATPARPFPCPAWDGAAPTGQTLVIHAEQGLGSAIHFVRYTPLVAERGARVVLECQPPLARLFRQSLLPPHGPLAEVVVKGDMLPACDRHVPLMSLPHRLGTTLATIPARVPYLRADPDLAAAWRERLAGASRPRVGLVWAGNRRHENDANRSMPAAALAPLVDGEGSWFSLQIPAEAADVAAFPPGRLVDLAPDLADFAETAAVLDALDLVISVDTAVAHLAGALARPVWLLLPFVPEWRWLLDRADSPWYPTMRLFRQRTAGDWAELVGRVRVALREVGDGA